MKIALGSDHAGYEAKEAIAGWLADLGHEVDDQGTGGDDSVDYPDFAERVARSVAESSVDLGILVCGTGIGIGIAANKIRGVRAATCHDEFTARMSRAHNDANVLCLGSRVLTAERMRPIVEEWLATGFEGGRHQRRLDKIARLEEEACRPV